MSQATESDVHYIEAIPETLGSGESSAVNIGMKSARKITDNSPRKNNNETSNKLFPKPIPKILVAKVATKGFNAQKSPSPTTRASRYS
jgi:hypothetical protein